MWLRMWIPIVITGVKFNENWYVCMLMKGYFIIRMSWAAMIFNSC